MLNSTTNGQIAKSAPYAQPVLISLGPVQDFVLGALVNGADADPEADNNQTS